MQISAKNIKLYGSWSFVGNDRALSKFRCQILHYLTSTIKLSKNQSMKANFILATRATLRTGIFLDMYFFESHKNHQKSSKKQKYHSNFHFRSFPYKTNDFIFFKSPKTLFWDLFRPFFLTIGIVLKNCALPLLSHSAPLTLRTVSKKTNE